MSQPACPHCGLSQGMAYIEDAAVDFTGSSEDACQRRYWCSTCGYESFHPVVGEPEGEHLSWQQRAVDEFIEEDEFLEYIEAWKWCLAMFGVEPPDEQE